MQRLMTKKDTIHIALASINNYAVVLAALIKSIIYNHHTDENIVFYIINDKISPSNKDKINSLINKSPEVQIVWTNAKELILKGMNYPIDNFSLLFTNFSRLFVPYIIDKDIEKLIIFDVNMIVLKDVSELWNIDLNGYSFAAVIEEGETVDYARGGIQNYKELRVVGGAKYFNSGLMIIDVKKWRDDEIPKKVFKVIEENIKLVNCSDQYRLNIVFGEKWLPIDPLWNWFANHYHPNPKNIHFVDIKPIFKSYRSEELFKQEFFKYLDLTPWKGMKLKSDYLRSYQQAIIKIKKKIYKFLSFS